MRIRAFLLMLAALPAVASAQSIITSRGPTTSSITVYRDPDGSGAMELGWLNGFAMVTETRSVSIPAGESELRFEGVASGLIPQSAVVEGLGDAVVEKNRDTRLLSPGTLFMAKLGQRVHLRRTSVATGRSVEQEAVIRSAGNGIVIETESGVETLRCTGLPETLLISQLPRDLSAKPTLSVRLRSERPVEATVQLTYLSTGFDWRAHYVASLHPDGQTLSLFAWMTLANGDETGFRDAKAMAVAGRLNREAAGQLQPETRPVSLHCWPNQRTHQIPDNPAYPPPPPPPSPPPAVPAPMAAVDAESIVVTGSRLMAEREALGDLKLYRIPIPVTVASRSQKQVALLEQARVGVGRFYRWATHLDNDQDGPRALTQVLRMKNRKQDGLGLPLPAGNLVLYTQHDGRPFLLGEGSMMDRAVGERVDVALSVTPAVMVSQRRIRRDRNEGETEIIVTNDLPVAAPVEIAINDSGNFQISRSSARLQRRDGQRYWVASVPANASLRLRVTYRALN